MIALTIVNRMMIMSRAGTFTRARGQLECSLPIKKLECSLSRSDDGKGLDEGDSPCNIGPVTCGLCQ